MATSDNEMFLSDAIKKFKFPIKLQLLEELVSLNHGQALDAGEIITIYGFDKQLDITAGSSMLYENLSQNNVLEEYTPMQRPRKVYVLRNCGEELKDVHCDGKKFKTIEKITENQPRYLKSDCDFFTLYVDEQIKGMARVEKGQILEFVRTVNRGNPGAYQNIAKNCQKDFLIYSINGEEIILTENNLTNLTCVSDPKHYSIISFLDLKFSFPRRLQFVDSDLQKHFEELTETPNPLILGLTGHERFFFATESKVFLEARQGISCIENVPVLYIDERKRERTKVQVLNAGENKDGPFTVLFAKETSVKKEGLTTFNLFGRTKKSSNDELLQSADKGKKTQTTAVITNPTTDSAPSLPDKEKQKQYEFIFPNPASQKSIPVRMDSKLQAEATQIRNPKDNSSPTRNTRVIPDSKLEHTDSGQSRTNTDRKSKSLPSTAKHQALPEYPDDEIFIVGPQQVQLGTGPHFHSAQGTNYTQSANGDGDEDMRYTSFPTRSKSVPAKHPRKVPALPPRNLPDPHKEEVPTLPTRDQPYPHKEEDPALPTRDFPNPPLYNEEDPVLPIRDLPNPHKEEVPALPTRDLPYPQKEEESRQSNSGSANKEDSHPVKVSTSPREEGKLKNISSVSNNNGNKDTMRAGEDNQGTDMAERIAGVSRNEDLGATAGERNIGQTPEDANINKTGSAESTDISGDIETMTVEELCQCLRVCGLPRLSEVFSQQAIDGEFLVALDDDDLKEEPFSLKPFELKKLKMMIKTGYRPKRNQP